ncbi:response regulator transcription factor [Chloroflexota bacterium]
MKILIIEDDPKIIEIVARTLETKWFEVNLLSTFHGKEGVELVKKELPDIVILDLMLPDTDGFEVLRQIRSFSDVMLIILTAKGEEDNRIRGLQEGADDYIVKPFSASELVARMKSLIRRMEMTETTATVARKPSNSRSLGIYFESQEVSVGSKLLKLGPRSYELLYLLVTNNGEVVSKQVLMKKVFPETDENEPRSVEVYINKLREQLEENPDNPKMILNEGTTGYKFVGSYSTVREALKETES